jgi:hypothetical protein
VTRMRRLLDMKGFDQSGIQHDSQTVTV